jgi:dihydrofolate reductase
MAKLIYAAISSLDGYVADAQGNFDWSMPSDEVHRFVNNLQRGIGTYLSGRRMYEVMRYWKTASTGNGEPSAGQEFAKIWAGNRQDHLLQEPGRGVHREDQAEPRIRPGVN